MAPKFRVPKCLEDLMELPNDDEDTLQAQDVIDIDSLDASEMHRLVTGVATELAGREVLCVQEQSVFNQLYSLVRGYAHLESSPKSILIDSLCTNFVQLNVTTSILINSIDDPNDDVEDVTQRSRALCNATKIYAYFLSSILIAEEAQPESSAGKNTESCGGSKKGRSRKKHVPGDWDWNSLGTRSLRALAGALQNDLKKIFDSPHLDESLITFLAKAAFKMLENRSLLEKGDCKKDLWTVISACTVQYGYGVSSVVTIIDMLHKFEHIPAHMADLVSSAQSQYSGSSLAVDLLRAIGKIDPASFERDSAGAENVGLFLEELTARLPKIMVANLSVILCHLDGKSHKMRNSIVKVIGRLLVGAKQVDGTSQSDVSRLRSEQRLLNILIERIRDISAHTRKQVLQTWAYLCTEHAVPIGHWNLVSDLAAGRLDDSTAIVRKNALLLLATLVEYNPFGPSLRAAAFEATYEKYCEMLSGMSPPKKTVSEAEQGEQNVQDMELNLSLEQENEAASESFDGTPASSGEKQPCSQPEHNSPQAQQSSPDPKLPAAIGGIEHTRALVASLESALRFSKCIGATLETLSQLLASSTIGDVESTIQLLILCKKFEVAGSGPCLRKTLPLVFSHETGIRSAVEEAFKTLYLKGTSAEVASNLINLTLEGSLGDLASIEELVRKSMSKREISAGTVSALWDLFTFNVQGCTADQSRAALTVLCMAAKSTPQILSSHLQNILDIGFGRWAKDDVLLARTACIALQRLPVNDRAHFRRTHKIFSILSNLIVRPGLSEACWYSAAEQAIKAIYVLHPAPESFSSGLLLKFAQSVFSSSQTSANRGLDTESGDIEQQCYNFSVSTVALSRFLFAVAHVALQHLVYIESCLKLVRKQRNDKERDTTRAAEESLADVGVAVSKEGDIAAELGLGASEDAKFDDLREQAETEILSGDINQSFLVGSIAPMVVRLCSNSAVMKQNQQLRSSALLALCKLMVIDASFCEKHLPLLFKVAQNSLEDSVRSNCVVALGDLALRFPNLVEPWMESMYARVHDKSTAVRKNTVLVLSHLILNDLIKVKGYISEMAMYLEDEDSRISELVKLFFHELSKKGNNPINNLLPEIVSRLSSNPALSQDKFNLVMQYLIGTIKKSKQMEGLIEKFCNRFLGTSGAKQVSSFDWKYHVETSEPNYAFGEGPAAQHARQWQDIAYCLCQLSYPQSCLKKLADGFKLYQHALGDAGVIVHFKSLIVKTRKLASGDVKLLLDEIEEKIMNRHNEKREQEEATEKAQEHHQRQKEHEEALIAQRLGELNLGRTASQGDELETQTEEEDSVVDGEQREATSIEIELETQTEEEDSVVDGDQREVASIKIPTFATVKGELIDIVLQGGSIRIQNDDIGGHSEHRIGSDATTSISVNAEEEEDGDVAASVEKMGNTGAQVVENVKHGDSGEVYEADSATISEGQSRELAEGFSAIRISELDSSEENTSGTQPYPYMDLNLESAPTQDPLHPASRDRAVYVKQENIEIQYNLKENPCTKGYTSDSNQMTCSPFIPAPPSLESPKAARTSTRRRLKKVDVDSQKVVKSFPAVKEERLSLDGRISRQSRVLRPHNE